ncbi:MAG: thiopurine S-methyltransferase [Pseudomonadota bacterium]
MEPVFWHRKWATGDIAFHEAQPNPSLTQHIDALELARPARWFVPLCGKSLDVAWLLARGDRVVGVELNASAIEALIESLDCPVQRTEHEPLVHYAGERVDLWVGDVLSLTSQQLGPVDAIYDRAALVALPGLMRKRYAAHLSAITNRSPQLIETFAYEQEAMAGPPFSVTKNELHQLYGAHYRIERLSLEPLAKRLKDQIDADIQRWLLSPMSA